jgi:peptide/nickel transport system substrate-binding protein
MWSTPVTASDVKFWLNMLLAVPQDWGLGNAYQLTEIASNLKGATPQSPTLSINPENWYFVK